MTSGQIGQWLVKKLVCRKRGNLKIDQHYTDFSDARMVVVHIAKWTFKTQVLFGLNILETSRKRLFQVPFPPDSEKHASRPESQVLLDVSRHHWPFKTFFRVCTCKALI